MVSECGRILVHGRALFGGSVLVSPLPLVLCSVGTGYGSRHFGRRARLGTALLSVVPMYSRGSGDIVVIKYVDYSKA